MEYSDMCIDHGLQKYVEHFWYKVISIWRVGKCFAWCYTGFRHGFWRMPKEAVVETLVYQESLLHFNFGKNVGE